MEPHPARVLAATALLMLLYCAPATAKPKSPKLSPQEMQKAVRKLTKKGWAEEEVKTALKLCRGQRDLFNMYKSLRGKGIPAGAINASFYRFKGNGKLITEYWGWIARYGFPPREVDQVFAKFPKNPITRYKYFAYRAGGADKKNRQKLEERKKQFQSKKSEQLNEEYSARECMAIFLNARFDGKLIEEYFKLRESGTGPQQAWQTIQKKVAEQEKKEREARLKKLEKERKRLQEKAEAQEEMRGFAEQQTGEKGEDDNEEKTKKGMVTGNELEALLSDLDEGDKDAKAEDESPQEAEDEAESADQGQQEPEEKSESRSDKEEDEGEKEE